jgi:hypothetical protein
MPCHLVYDTQLPLDAARLLNISSVGFLNGSPSGAPTPVPIEIRPHVCATLAMRGRQSGAPAISTISTGARRAPPNQPWADMDQQ